MVSCIQKRTGGPSPPSQSTTSAQYVRFRHETPCDVCPAVCRHLHEGCGPGPGPGTGAADRAESHWSKRIGSERRWPKEAPHRAAIAAKTSKTTDDAVDASAAASPPTVGDECHDDTEPDGAQSASAPTPRPPSPQALSPVFCTTGDAPADDVAAENAKPDDAKSNAYQSNWATPASTSGKAERATSPPVI